MPIGIRARKSGEFARSDERSRARATTTTMMETNVVRAVILGWLGAAGPAARRPRPPIQRAPAERARPPPAAPAARRPRPAAPAARRPRPAAPAAPRPRAAPAAPRRSTPRSVDAPPTGNRRERDEPTGQRPGPRGRGQDRLLPGLRAEHGRHVPLAREPARGSDPDHRRPRRPAREDRAHHVQGRRQLPDLGRHAAAQLVLDREGLHGEGRHQGQPRLGLHVGERQHERPLRADHPGRRPRVDVGRRRQRQRQHDLPPRQRLDRRRS